MTLIQVNRKTSFLSIAFFLHGNSFLFQVDQTGCVCRNNTPGVCNKSKKGIVIILSKAIVSPSFRVSLNDSLSVATLDQMTLPGVNDVALLQTGPRVHLLFVLDTYGIVWRYSIINNDRYIFILCFYV